jgi:hypothetical protein
MGCCSTKIVQVAGGAGGGGPFTVAPNTPGAGQTTVTDTTSGNSFIIPAGINVYNADDSLTGNRVMNSAGFDFTFNGGGDFIIDGKLTVTGIIDPTGLQFTGGVQADAGMPNGTIFVTDGSASGIPSGEIIFKDFTGNYHRLENVASPSTNIYNANGSLTGTRTLTANGFDLTFDMGANQFNSLYASGTNNAQASNTAFVMNMVTSENVTFSQAAVTSGGGTQAFLRVDDQLSGQYNLVEVNVTGIALDFKPTSDLTINGNPGSLGQVLTSNGNNLPPSWQTPVSASPRGIFVKNTTSGINSASLQSLAVTATVSWTSIAAGAAVNPGALVYPGVTADISIGASAITIQTPGVYKVDIAVKFSDLAFGNQYFLSAFKNSVNKSVDAFMGRDADSSGAIFTGGRVSFIDSFAIGDTISARVGTTLANSTLEINHVQFDLVRLGA